MMDGTTQLLARWRAGDEAALGDLLAQHLPWVRERVRQLLGPELREKVTSEDLVQEAAIEFLRYGPKFVPENGRQLRGLLARIVANTVADNGGWFHAARRNMAAEAELTSSLGLLDDPSDADPAVRAEHAELANRLRLALELLDSRERQLIVLRNWQREPFAAIASQLGVGEEAARTAWRRAVDRLRETMTQLRRGGLDAILRDA